MMLDVFFISVLSGIVAELSAAFGEPAPVHRIFAMLFLSRIAVVFLGKGHQLHDVLKEPVLRFSGLMEKTEGLSLAFYEGSYAHYVFVMVCALVLFIAWLGL